MTDLPTPGTVEPSIYAGELGHALHPSAVLSFGPTFQKIHLGQPNQVDTHAGIHIGASQWCRSKDTRKFRQQNLTFVETIGKGSYGVVYKAAHLVTGEQFAIKQVAAKANIQCGFKTFRTDLIWKERDILLTLQHPRVVKLLGAFYEYGSHFVFELCRGDIQGKSYGMTDRTKLRFCLQLLQGLEWIHSKNILHCDIRPENLLITMSNNLVISDFGSATLLPKGEDFIKMSYCKSVPAYSDHLARSKFIFGKPTDIFAAACVIYEIQTGDLLQFQLLESESPTSSNSEQHNNNDDLIPRAIKSPLGLLLRKMLIHDIYARASAAECLRDSDLQQNLIHQNLTTENVDEDAEEVNCKFGLPTKKQREYQKIETNYQGLQYALHLIYYEAEEPKAQENLSAPSTMPVVEMEAYKVVDANLLKQFIDINTKCFLTTPVPVKSIENPAPGFVRQTALLQSTSCQDPTSANPVPSLALHVSTVNADPPTVLDTAIVKDSTHVGNQNQDLEVETMEQHEAKRSGENAAEEDDNEVELPSTTANVQEMSNLAQEKDTNENIESVCEEIEEVDTVGSSLDESLLTVGYEEEKLDKKHIKHLEELEKPVYEQDDTEEEYDDEDDDEEDEENDDEEDDDNIADEDDVQILPETQQPDDKKQEEKIEEKKKVDENGEENNGHEIEKQEENNEELENHGHEEGKQDDNNIVKENEKLPEPLQQEEEEQRLETAGEGLLSLLQIFPPGSPSYMSVVEQIKNLRKSVTDDSFNKPSSTQIPSPALTISDPTNASASAPSFALSPVPTTLVKATPSASEGLSTILAPPTQTNKLSRNRKTIPVEENVGVNLGACANKRRMSATDGNGEVPMPPLKKTKSGKKVEEAKAIEQTPSDPIPPSRKNKTSKKAEEAKAGEKTPSDPITPPSKKIKSAKKVEEEKAIEQIPDPISPLNKKKTGKKVEEKIRKITPDPTTPTKGKGKTAKKTAARKLTPVDLTSPKKTGKKAGKKQDPIPSTSKAAATPLPSTSKAATRPMPASKKMMASKKQMAPESAPSTSPVPSFRITPPELPKAERRRLKALGHQWCKLCLEVYPDRKLLEKHVLICPNRKLYL